MTHDVECGPAGDGRGLGGQRDPLGPAPSPGLQPSVADDTRPRQHRLPGGRRAVARRARAQPLLRHRGGHPPSAALADSAGRWRGGRRVRGTERRPAGRPRPVRGGPGRRAGALAGGDAAAAPSRPVARQHTRRRPPGDCRFRGRRRFKGRRRNVERRPSGGAAGAAQAGGHLRRGDPHRAARCGATRHGGDVSLLGGAGRRRGPPRAARVQSALRPQQPGAGRFPHRLPLPPGRVVGPGAGRRLGGLRVGRRRPAPTAAHPTGSAGPHRHEPHRLEPHRAGSHGRAACPTFRRPEARRSSLGRSEP